MADGFLLAMRYRAERDQARRERDELRRCWVAHLSPTSTEERT